MMPRMPLFSFGALVSRYGKCCNHFKAQSFVKAVKETLKDVVVLPWRIFRLHKRL